MPIAYRQDYSNVGWTPASVSVPLQSATLNGSLIVASVLQTNVFGWTLTDNFGNTYNTHYSVVRTWGSWRLQVFWAYNIVGGSSHTITATPTGGTDPNEGEMLAAEFTGAARTSDPFDQSSSAYVASSGGVITGTATPPLSQADEMAYAASFGEGYYIYIQPGSGFSESGYGGSLGSSSFAAEYKIVSSTDPVTPTFTTNIATSYPVICVTFRAEQLGVRPSIAMHHLRQQGIS
jgi:hypothetical protein